MAYFKKIGLLALLIVLFSHHLKTEAQFSQKVGTQAHQVFFEHSTILGRGKITSLAWRPDQTVLAVASELGIWLYSEALTDLDYLPTQTKIIDIGWHPTRNEVVAVDEDGLVTVWDMATQQSILNLQTQDSHFTTGIWNATGEFFASGTHEGIILIWDGDLRDVVNAIETSAGTVISLAWSPSGNTLAIGNEDGSLWLWDAQTDTIQQWQADSLAISTLVWSPDENLIASGTQNYLEDSMKIWDAATGTAISTLTNSRSIMTAFWNSDTNLITTISYSSAEIQVWNPSTGKLISSYTLDDSWGFDLSTWSHDGTKLTTVGYIDGKISIWEANTFESLATTHGHNPWALTTVDWQPDGDWLVASGISADMWLWDTQTNRLLAKIQTNHKSIFANWIWVSWNREGDKILSQSADSQTEIWSVTQNANTILAENLLSQDGPSASSWNSNGTEIAWLVNSSRLDGEVKIEIRALNGETSRTLYTQNAPPYFQNIAWSAEQNKLAIIDSDGTVFIWDTETGNIVNMIPTTPSDVYLLEWDSTSHLLSVVASWDGIAQIIDTQTGQVQMEVKLGSRIVDTAWNSYGHIAFALESEVQLWDTETGEMIDQLEPTTQGTINALDWNGQNTNLAVALDNGLVEIWRWVE